MISGWACYKLGQYLDQSYGTTWMAIAGMMLGCAAGMYETFRQAMRIEGFDKNKKKKP